MRNRKTILFSARDAAAALYAAPIIETALDDVRFRVVVVAQEPALNIMTRRGIKCITITTSPVDDLHGAETQALLQEAECILKNERPDSIVAGLSSPGQGGIDEALMRMRSCKGFLLQDFWGEWNCFFDRKPDVFLVLDRAAAKLTMARHGVGSIVVGSPRHAEYAGLDIASMRQNARLRLGLLGGPVIGWFGQALHHLPGYAQTITAWSSAIRDLPVGVEVVYKPHPRESEEERQATLEIIRASVPKVHFLEGWPVEDALVVCDSVCAIMSNCLYDAAYLNFYSNEPVITPVAILQSALLYTHLVDQVSFEVLPYGALGLANVALPENDLSAQLLAALGPSDMRDCWQAAKKHLASPDQAIDNVLNAIMAQFDES
ncbi:MAG: hypothetical protein COB78_13270 [Hyphomicrobiales bacterium]|nr:MAG: hypothetical protein COB78_13270 [Hyphomicrobiales bacterium]